MARALNVSFFLREEKISLSAMPATNQTCKVISNLVCFYNSQKICQEHTRIVVVSVRGWHLYCLLYLLFNPSHSWKKNQFCLFSCNAEHDLRFFSFIFHNNFQNRKQEPIVCYLKNDLPIDLQINSSLRIFNYVYCASDAQQKVSSVFANLIPYSWSCNSMLFLSRSYKRI